MHFNSSGQIVGAMIIFGDFLIYSGLMGHGKKD
jgi:hypothetical protein